jgi:hypothetical protein
MGNENEMTNPQGGDLSDLKKMFSDYQKKQEQSQPRKRKTSEEILAKYFVPRKTKETFRILPPKPGKKRIEEAFFHVVSTNDKGGKKKHGTVIYCPAHNDPKVAKLDSKGSPILDGNGNQVMIPSPCPLCDKHKKIIAKQDTSIKYIKKDNMTDEQKKINESNKLIFADANKWEAKKFYIIRGVDKGAEKDGVKFWRFKHSFKNQGTLDKLLPILDAYVNTFQTDFADEKRGTDLSLTMADSEFNGRTYKTLSAVIFGQPSALHNDSIVIRQWLDDDITWRDVFIPKKAPNTTPYQYLEMVANDVNPYWDDMDATNKHWVFPGNPKLEELANTRKANLDNDDDDSSFEQASDLDQEYANITVSNVTPQNVGTYKEDAIEMTPVSRPVSTPAPTFVPLVDETPSPIDNYDDLPF